MDHKHKKDRGKIVNACEDPGPPHPQGYHGRRENHGHHVHAFFGENGTEKRLLATLALNLFIPLVQIAGGLFAHSMALVSDALHNLSDFTAVLISYIAHRIGRRGASTRNTFGYRRAEVIAALVNGAILAAASTFIVYHAVKRLFHPEAVLGQIVILAAIAGIVGNGLSAWLLHRDAGHNINIRGAFLHMMGDLMTSVAVLVSGLVLMWRPWYWLDPVLSLLIVAYILVNSWKILKESAAILMNATPERLDLHEVRRTLCGLPGVSGIHYVHAWPLDASGVAFSCHVVVPDQALSQTEKTAERIRAVLGRSFGIDHPVLQFETRDCGDGGMLCGISCSTAGRSAHDGSGAPDGGPEWRGGIVRAAYHVARIVLGVTFVYASIHKVLDPAAFATAVYNYQILPGSLVNLAALVLPWLELIVGAMLILNVWMPGAVTVVTGLLVVFAGALVFNMARGLDIGCGCFTTASAENDMTLLTALRDGAFLVLSLFLLFLTLRKGGPDAAQADRPGRDAEPEPADDVSAGGRKR